MRGPRRRFGRSGEADSEDRERDNVLEAKREARELARRKRDARRAPRPDSFQARARAGATEAGRRLAPAGRRILSFLARIAPPISNALMAAARGLALGLLWLEQRGQRGIEWLGAHAVPLAGRWLRAAAARVTPVNTYAAVAVGAAIALGVSQFLDYRGVAVGAPQYEGEVGVVAPPPLTDVKIAGSAHLYVLVPVAAAALVLIVLTFLGRWRLGRWVTALGLIGIAVSLVVDVPKGLDTGTAGVAFAGADAELLKGFWIQLTSSIALVVCGLLLAREVRESAAQPERPGSPAGRPGAEGKRLASAPAPPRWGARA